MDDCEYPNPEDQIGFLLWQLSNAWDKRVNSVLSELHQNQSQYFHLAGLAWLSCCEDNITQARLAAYTRTNQMLTSKVVRSLEKAKLITRKQHKTDTRAKVLEVTDLGYEVVFAALEKVMQADNTFFKVPNKSACFKVLKSLLNNNE